MTDMTYSQLTIQRDGDGSQVVRRPRVTDVIGHALRGAFDEPRGLPDDMARALRSLDAGSPRLN